MTKGKDVDVESSCAPSNAGAPSSERLDPFSFNKKADRRSIGQYLDRLI